MPSTKYYELISQIIPDVDFHQNHYARKLDAIVGRGARWLDVGAGAKLHDGFGVASAAELASRCREVIGIDFEVEHMQSNPNLSSFVAGGGDSMPFPDNRFDLITANMVLEHLDFPDDVFREISRVLAPEGRFVFVTPNKNHPGLWTASKLLRPHTQRLLAHRLEGRALEHIFPTFYRANTRGDIERLAQKSGLSVESIDVVRNIPFMTRPMLMTWLECHFIRFCAKRMLTDWGADLIGVLSKPALDKSCDTSRGR